MQTKKWMIQITGMVFLVIGLAMVVSAQQGPTPTTNSINQFQHIESGLGASEYLHWMHYAAPTNSDAAGLSTSWVVHMVTGSNATAVVPFPAPTHELPASPYLPPKND